MRSVIEPTAKSAYGRHRRDGSPPFGNTNATASGHAKKTGQREDTSAAQEPPGSDPGCASSATHAYGVAASTAARDSAPTTRIQPIGFRACRPTMSAPTAAGAETAATRNGYSHAEPESGTCSRAAIRSSTSPPVTTTSAASARHQAITRGADRTLVILAERCAAGHSAATEPRIRLQLSREMRLNRP